MHISHHYTVRHLQRLLPVCRSSATLSLLTFLLRARCLVRHVHVVNRLGSTAYHTRAVLSAKLSFANFLLRARCLVRQVHVVNRLGGSTAYYTRAVLSAILSFANFLAPCTLSRQTGSRCQSPR